MGRELVSHLPSFLQEDKGFWIRGGRKEGFLRPRRGWARPGGRNERGHHAVRDDIGETRFGPIHIRGAGQGSLEAGE